MPHTLKQIPAYWAGDLIVANTDVGQANLRPDNMGLTVANVTGSSIPAGSLVYVSGWDTTVVSTGQPSISLATASTMLTRAQFVTLAAIGNNASGVVGSHLALTAQNTNAATVGDAVYLGVTAGAFTLTAPDSAANTFQVVGRVAVKSATVGVVEFNLLSGDMSVPIWNETRSFNPITIPTTGSPAARALWCSKIAGTLGNVRVGGSVALATSDSNFLQFSLVNHGHTDGTGTTQMLNQASGASSTKATGGGALIAFGGTALVPSTTAANLAIAVNDVLELTATVTGTLANTVTDAFARLTIVPG